MASRVTFVLESILRYVRDQVTLRKSPDNTIAGLARKQGVHRALLMRANAQAEKLDPDEFLKAAVSFYVLSKRGTVDDSEESIRISQEAAAAVLREFVACKNDYDWIHGAGPEQEVG